MSSDLILTAIVSLIVGMAIWNWWIYGRHQVRTRYPPDWDTLRREVYRRASHTCQNCGRDDRVLNAHHIVPLSVGGTNELTNLACLCRDCHKLIHVHMR